MHPSLLATRNFVAFSLLCVLALTLRVNVSATDAVKDQKYTARIIWGTDEEKPADKNLKAVDGELAKKFGKIFKWKYYFETSSKDIDVKSGEPKHVTLSDKCDIKLNLTQNEALEVELFGDKNLVYKGKQSMPLNDILILAGEDKNATAWFVVLQPRK